MALADHDRLITLQQQAALIPTASRLAVAFVVSIMAMATVKADMQALVVEVSTLVTAAMAGKLVALDSCQASGAPVAEVGNQVDLVVAVEAYTKAPAIQVAQRTWEPGAWRDRSKIAIMDHPLASQVVQ